MAYFLSVTLWLIALNCVLYLKNTPFFSWGFWQWIFFFFALLCVGAGIFCFIMGKKLSRINKEEKCREEEQRRARQALHYNLTYEGIDIVPEEEMDPDDYNVYMRPEEGDVIGPNGETLVIHEDNTKDAPQ